MPYRARQATVKGNSMAHRKNSGFVCRQSNFTHHGSGTLTMAAAHVLLCGQSADCAGEPGSERLGRQDVGQSQTSREIYVCIYVCTAAVPEQRSKHRVLENCRGDGSQDKRVAFQAFKAFERAKGLELTATTNERNGGDEEKGERRSSSQSQKAEPFTRPARFAAVPLRERPLISTGGYGFKSLDSHSPASPMRRATTPSGGIRPCKCSRHGLVPGGPPLRIRPFGQMALQSLQLHAVGVDAHQLR